MNTQEMEIAGKVFQVGFSFRHEQGGTWKITDIYSGFTHPIIEIEPTFGTKIKPQIEGRIFRIKGVWFKVMEQTLNRVVLTHFEKI